MPELIPPPKFFFVVQHAACGEKIIFGSHNTPKIHVTLMQEHDCPKDNLSYVIQISRGFVLKKQPQAKDEPRDPDSSGSKDPRDNG